MISAATEEDHPRLIEVWELSVRATHHFLPEDYLREIKILLPAIFPQVKIVVWKENGIVQGFAGVAEQKIEMLFVHPQSMGQGIGKRFVNYCIEVLKADKVDVNEQNEAAVAFYKKMGYKMIGRKERDSMGRPFPILELQHF